MFGTTSSSALRAGGRTLETVQRRLFSVSASQRAGQIVTFRKASSPELQSTLDTLYNKIILPSYLTQEQQRKMYRVKYERELAHEPITMEIDGVVHKFHYQDMMKLPHAYQLISDFINNMKTPGDWDNLPRLLEGLKHAHRKVDEVLYAKMIRRAALAHRLDVIVTCIKSVKRTGFKLDSAEKIQELLTQLTSRAVNTGYGEYTTNRSLQQIQQIIEELEAEPAHLGDEGLRLQLPFYGHPLVLGARLHLAAAKAYYLKDKDTVVQVQRYAEELMALWPEGKGVLDLEPSAAYTDRSKLRFLMDRNNFLYHVTPIYQGLNLAVKMVDPGLAMQLQNRADAVEGELRAAMESPERKAGGRGEVMYNWIFNRKEMKKKRAAEVRAEQEAKEAKREEMEEKQKRREQRRLFHEEQARKKAAGEQQPAPAAEA
ncbi:hypothetical protein QBC35DRAFT_500109 [Podospora australis]|uniref:Uncharacterized protein n=1 Tax=Podospora australis TaxID=1536484 RepID=A0AAN6WUY2_9PEZI|nr:hypothetical protein QBC35DRAFT_500109 [Podospora australis]